ncbi:hypothetical protein CRG98_048057 [Punica granatum]|uniref:Retrovirus-related Pol polyprotein from transposon TNT 1-94-like beta-barrel domain-containing protein n=1 Tax=Punica granatum TaxID=22663 RepID=A0A2I0HIM8_PUNGR|nr:hypothetical protein CRG98_048057 [Punica granatum]
MEKSHFEMEKFDSRKDFELWKIKIHDVLIQRGLHKALLGKEKKPESMKDEEWDELNEKAVSTIRLCLADEWNYQSLKQKQGNDRKADDRNTAAAAPSSGAEGETLLCTSSDCDRIQDPIVELIVDSATSYHCTPIREFFTTYKAGDLGSVKMGNQSIAKIVRIGDIIVRTIIGCTITLKDVHRIKELRLNLCLRRCLTEKDIISNLVLVRGS